MRALDGVVQELARELAQRPLVRAHRGGRGGLFEVEVPVGHDLDGFGLHRGLAGKHQVEQTLACDGPARLREQWPQQGRFAKGQVHRLAVEIHRAVRRGAVHAAEAGHVGGTAAAGEGAHERFEFIQVKGLGQVIVGAGFQAEDAVAHRAAGGRFTAGGNSGNSNPGRETSI